MSARRPATVSGPSKFPALDLLRGGAALAVVTVHYSPYLEPVVLPSAYLAVDLFFLMSGAVISHAYDRKLLSGMTAASFVLARLIRLFPMYILGTLISATAIAGALLLGTKLTWTWQQLALTTAAALVMAPVPPLPGKLPALFVLNFPAWSLFLEILSNIGFGYGFRLLSGRVIVALIGIGAIATAACAIRYGDLMGGWLWSNAIVGVARVTFSFFLGVLMYRKFRDGSLARLAMPSWLILIISLALFAAQPDKAWRPLYDTACVFLAFPVLLLAALSNGSAADGRVSAFLGAISYPLYAIHIPVQFVVSGVITKVVGQDPERYAPGLGLVLVLALILASWLLARTYDVWVRSALMRYMRAARRDAPDRPSVGRV